MLHQLDDVQLRFDRRKDKCLPCYSKTRIKNCECWFA